MWLTFVATTDKVFPMIQESALASIMICKSLQSALFCKSPVKLKSCITDCSLYVTCVPKQRQQTSVMHDFFVKN